MIEVAYSREAMRALLMLDAGERERAIETIDKLSKAYDALRTEAENAAAQEALKAAELAEEKAKAASENEKSETTSDAKTAAASTEAASETDAGAEDGESEASENPGNDDGQDNVATADAASENEAADDGDENDGGQPEAAADVPATIAQSQSENQLSEEVSPPKEVELPPIEVPGTLPLGGRGDFCLAPFSKTGDFVVALTDKITVVSLIDILDDLQEASSK